MEELSLIAGKKGGFGASEGEKCGDMATTGREEGIWKGAEDIAQWL